MVRRIDVEPDLGHPYDQDFQNSVHPEQGFATGDVAHLQRDRSLDRDSFHNGGSGDRARPVAESILCMAGTDGPALHGTGHHREEGVHPAFRGTAVMPGTAYGLGCS